MGFGSRVQGEPQVLLHMVEFRVGSLDRVIGKCVTRTELGPERQAGSRQAAEGNEGGGTSLDVEVRTQARLRWS